MLPWVSSLAPVRACRTGIPLAHARCVLSRYFSQNTEAKTQTTKPDKRIILFASEVSSIVGLNPYRYISEPFEETWKRTWPDRYDRALAAAEKIKQAPVLSKQQEAEEVLFKYDLESTQQEALAKAMEATQSIEGLRRIKQEVIEKIERTEGMSIEEKKLLKDHTVSALNKGFGVQNEEQAIKKFEFVARTRVHSSNTKFYMRELGLTHPHATPWALGGRIDGFDGGDELIEIKNRTRKFLDPLPSYDKVQFHCYLNILQLEEGQLVEHLKMSERAEDSTKSTRIVRDEEFWQETLLPRMQNFCDFLDQFCQEEHLEHQVDYLLRDQEGKFDVLAPIHHRMKYFVNEQTERS